MTGRVQRNLWRSAGPFPFRRLDSPSFVQMFIYSNHNRSTTPAGISSVEIDPREETAYSRIYSRILWLRTPIAVGNHSCQDVFVRNGIRNMHGSSTVPLAGIFTTFGESCTQHPIVDLELVIITLVAALIAGQDRDSHFLQFPGKTVVPQLTPSGDYTLQEKQIIRMFSLLFKAYSTTTNLQFSKWSFSECTIRFAKCLIFSEGQ